MFFLDWEEGHGHSLRVWLKTRWNNQSMPVPPSKPSPFNKISIDHARRVRRRTTSLVCAVPSYCTPSLNHWEPNQLNDKWFHWMEKWFNYGETVWFGLFSWFNWIIDLQCIVLFPSNRWLMVTFDRQFDRSGRTKSESLSGLEEVLTCLQPSTFFDDQLSRYRGLCWMDFLSSVQQQRPSNKASKSTLTSTTEEAATTPVASGSKSPIHQATTTTTPARNVLVRQSTQQDYSSRIKVKSSSGLFCSCANIFLEPAFSLGHSTLPLTGPLLTPIIMTFDWIGVDSGEKGTLRFGADDEWTMSGPKVSSRSRLALGRSDVHDGRERRSIGRCWILSVCWSCWRTTAATSTATTDLWS